MSDSKGIFDTFPNPGTTARNSPFAVAPEQSPFAPAPRQPSPFAVVDEPQAPQGGADSPAPVKLPEKRRPAESPFQVADAREGFGFEAAPAAFAAVPFEPAAAAPFSAAPSYAPEPPPAVAASSWEPARAVAAPESFSAGPAAPLTAEPQPSDSQSIRQLELRAIFGVDRELNAEEILQRARALPGIRHIARVGARDMAAVESLRTLLPNLGFGGGPLKLYSGSVPLDFIREGGVLLAVQSDGGYAPGVRETLMIVARELNRMV